MIRVIEEGDKRRCPVCKRRVHKDEILSYGCLICNEAEKAILTEELIEVEAKWGTNR